MPEREGALAPQFDDLAQQREADTLGMWVFLATEILLFGGLFLSYAVYSTLYPAAFTAASSGLDLVLGGINTVVLITSGLTMALAEHASEAGRRKTLIVLLIITALLGAAFLGIKRLEYAEDVRKGLVPFPGLGLAFRFEGADPQHAALFYTLYFAMTGLHAVHLGIGVVVLGVLIALALGGHDTVRLDAKVHMAGLYWALIDVIWLFLYPLLYLTGGHV